MYPNLLVPLLITVLIGLAAVVLFAARQPVSRRLAVRQIARRPLEASLAIIGSILGTAIIIGALVVGDTLNFSVRQEAYRTLGPIDERITAPNSAVGGQVNARLATLRGNPNVDGVFTTSVDQAAAVRGSRAEPRVLAWQLDFPAAAGFGGAAGATGISGPTPKPGHVVINEPFANSLGVHRGQIVTLFLYGRGFRVRIDRVLAQRGLAGAGLGATLNRDIFVAPGTLDAAAAAAGTMPRSVTFVSNRGSVEGGNHLTSTVTRDIGTALGPLAASTQVATPKHDVLKAAKTTGDALGSVFLMIGSFSIIAGALLLVNIFVMLGEERKSQLGVLRAVGMKRSWLIGSFTMEGAAYAILSAIPGIAVGIGVGYAVALVAAQIFKSWSATGTGLNIAFAVTPTSIINGTALGLVIALLAILLTSVRISRFNIIAAIRDLPTDGGRQPRRRALAFSTSAAILCAVAAVPAVIRSQPELTFILPALAVACATPLLLRIMPRRAALSLVSGTILVWSLVASVVRPHVFDTPSMAIFVILGTLTAFSGVVLVSENQAILLRPFRRLTNGPGQAGLATRLAVAYPLAKRFRTGATLVMYTLIMLVLVLLTEITGVINASVNRSVAEATAGYTLRLDFNPRAGGGVAPARIAETGGLTRVAPLVSAVGESTDPGHRTKDLLDTVVVGVPPNAITSMSFGKRLTGLRSNSAVWSALAQHPDYVVLDPFYGATGGPAGSYYKPGDHLTLVNPATGRSERKTIAGILTNGMIFYPNGESQTVYPLVTSDAAVRQLYGPAAQVNSALATTAPGVSADRLAPSLQARYLGSSLVATPVATNVRHLYAANTAFFRLMQGFLALGLLVGVSGLGIVMVRAVRERRRDIGVLRALGFQSRTIEQSFLTESSFVALQGIVLGAILGVLTTWLMYQKSAQFANLHGGFPIEWATIGLLLVATFIASMLATIGPARRAARISPALAVRVAG